MKKKDTKKPNIKYLKTNLIQTSKHTTTNKLQIQSNKQTNKPKNCF